VIELRTIRGPLDDEQLGWITDLYGPVDPKYGSLEFVRHQFVGNPYGWSAHAFAIDDGKAVGHCAAVPFCARLGGQPLVAGKIEAVVIAESHRGRRTESGGSLILELLSTMYAFAHENGVAILFGLAPPRVAAIHARAGCRRVTVDAPTYVLVTGPLAVAREWSTRRKIAAVGLSVAQNALAATAYAAARAVTGAWGAPRVEVPTAADAELAVSTAVDGRWTVSGAEAWEWYAGSGVLRAVEIDGRFGSRAIVRLRESDAAAVQIVAWRPKRPGSLPALLLLGALRGVARRGSAPSLRFQPWQGSGGDGRLAHACRLLGFARRGDTELVVHWTDPALDGVELLLTPFFYVTF
jgi:hypothetical protein